MVKHFIELLRPINSMMAAIAVFVGAVVVGGTDIVSLTELHLAIIATFLITGAGMTINDFYDRDIDFLNKRHRPIPSGRIAPKGAFMFSMVLFAVGIYITYFINFYCFNIALVNSFLLFVYSRKFKKILLVGHVFVSYLVASSFILGGLAVNAGGLMPLFTIALISFFSNFSREIIKTIEDMRGDRLGKVKSLPILIGEKSARKIASILIGLTIFFAPLPYLFGYMGNSYMYVVSIGLVLFVFSIIWNQRETPAGKVHKLMKVAMFISLIAFLVGAIF